MEHYHQWISTIESDDLPRTVVITGHTKHLVLEDVNEFLTNWISPFIGDQAQNALLNQGYYSFYYNRTLVKVTVDRPLFIRNEGPTKVEKVLAD